METDKVLTKINKLKQKESSYIEDIEIIEFLYNNTKYNFDNFFKEDSKDAGFQINTEGLKALGATTLKMKLPMTIWADIKFFEFNSFLTNTIRTINFLLEYKLKYHDKKEVKRQISISQYILNNQNKDDFMYNYLEKEFNDWINKVNDLRNNIIHKRIIRKIEGYYKVDAKIEKGGLKNKQERLFGIKEYDIDNLNIFIEDTFQKLEHFITVFIKKRIRS